MGKIDINSRGQVGRESISVWCSIGVDLDPDDKTKIAATTTPVLPSQAPINILIVDDEPKNLTVLEAILDDPGYRLVRAASAEQALLALLADEFALLILDIRMPDVTGFELAQMIKARKKNANVPIIFLTAYYNEDQHIIEGYDTGAVDYLNKPVNPAILRSKVAIFAELHRKQRNLEEVNRALLAEVSSRRRAAERPAVTRVPSIPCRTPLRDGAGNIIGAINLLVDVSERKQAETQQRILLNELNHRVKNNMQMLQILLEAGTRRAKSSEAREVLDEASSRVMAMAAAQRVLYTTPDATRFNARASPNAVCETAKQTFPQELAIDYEADAIQLSNDAAMPLALIANELLTNAVKYGLDRQSAGTIRVRLKRDDESLLFYVEDDGPGFDLQSVQRRSSGLALVQGLARQLGGKFEVARTPATRCCVRFQ